MTMTMTMTRQEMKERAKESLGRNLFGSKWMMGLVVSLIFGAVLWATSSILGAGALIFLGPMLIGYLAVMLSVSRTHEKADIAQMFEEGFSKDFARAFLVGLLKSLFISLWSLLFVVPGIVKAYSYAMAEYIAADHPEYDWKQCIDESRKLMDGHKWKLFVLDLSFLGWIIVSAFTFGIGYLWLAPYMTAARTEFYRDLIGDKAAGYIEEETEEEVEEATEEVVEETTEETTEETIETVTEEVAEEATVE